MICETKFDPKRDIQETRPGLAVDLEKAITTGELENTGTESEYNEINDPSSIRFRVSDPFQAIDIQRSIQKKANSAKTSPAVNTGSTLSE